MTTPISSLEELTLHNIEDIVEAFRLKHIPVASYVARLAAHYPAQRISKQVLEYADRIDEEGLLPASRWLIDTFTGSLTVSGVDNIPLSGPLLLTSNHPGMVDAMTIFATLPRSDLQIIAKDRALLHLLHSIKRYLIFTDDQSARPVSALRATYRHLCAGGSLLLFSAGKIEPDPALRRTAVDSLSDWSASIDLLTRRVPDLTVLPVAVSGVISQEAARHPITRLYHSQSQRDWVAATLMVLWPAYRDVAVKLQYGSPIRAEAGVSVGDQVREQMRDLYNNVSP